ncbi:MAG: hypothetical protein Q7S47_01925 [bacterium]|nr:hypothetical protein [bacterium]
MQPIAQVTTGSQPSNINTTSKPQSKTIIETADEIQTSSSRKLGVIQKPVKTKTSLPIKKGVIANQLITANSDVDVLKNDALVDSAIALLSSTEKLSADSTPIRNEVDTNSAAPRYPSSPESNQGAVLIIILSVLAAISLAGGAVFWGLSRRK